MDEAEKLGPDKAEQVMEISQMINPLLADKGPAIQGGVIVDILAKYLAGHLPVEIRQKILDDILEVTWKLVEVYHEEFHEASKDDTQH